MRNGSTIMMIFPGDTDPTPVPSDTATVAKAKQAGATFYRVPLTKMINAARPFAAQGLVPQSVAPAMGKFATDPQTVAMAATAPMTGGASLLTRGPTGMGAAGVTAAAEGQPVVPNMLLAGAPEPLGDAAVAGVKGGAEIFMKSALGRSVVGSVAKALKYGLAPTEKFINGVAEKIATLKNGSRAAAERLQELGHSTTYGELAKPLKAEIARYARSDVTGSGTQDALSEILGEMKNKVGPQTTTTPASAILGPGAGATVKGSAKGASAAIPARATVTPAQPISPAQLQEINEIAGDKLKELFAAKQGKLGVAPDPRRELGIMKVWSQSKRLLEGMGGDVGKSIGQANKEMQNLYKMDILARNAGMRAQAFTGIEKAAAGSGVIGGALTHNPAAAIGSIPLMLGLHAAMSPEGMAAMARGMNSPLGQGMARFAPRAAATGVGQFLNP